MNLKKQYQRLFEGRADFAKANNLKDREVKGILDFFKAMKSNSGGKYGIKN